MELKKNIHSYQHGGKIDALYDNEALNIYRDYIKSELVLFEHYKNFWINIYYNHAYVFYKNAIEFYQNVQGDNYHSGFSATMNRKLYEGSCSYIDIKKRKEWIDEKIKDELTITNTNVANLDDLCRTSVMAINIIRSSI